MSEKFLQDMCQRILDCDSEPGLVKISKRINSHRRSINIRDFMIIQSLILAKGNEIAITNIIEIMSLMDQGIDLLSDIPDMNKRH